MDTHDNLYIGVVGVTKELLGPAAERFVDRQIRTHLKIDPDELMTRDLSRLIDWLKVSIALLTDDPRVVDSYVRNLKRLATTKVR